MTATFLDEILRVKREKVRLKADKADRARLRSTAVEFRAGCGKHTLRQALARKGSNNIIAEIKRASPSKGVINDTIDVAAAAKAYENGGAAAISVLTEENFFKGSLDDLITAKNAVKIPVLRKDFIVDEFQLYESAAAGADVILLIVAALEMNMLSRFMDIARDELGLDVIVEVHTQRELDIAGDIGADIIGINNRDLRTFAISLETSRELVINRPRGALMIAESGLSSRAEIEGLRQLGFDGFLIGEALMKTSDPERTLREWL